MIPIGAHALAFRIGAALPENVDECSVIVMDLVMEASTDIAAAYVSVFPPDHPAIPMFRVIFAGSPTWEWMEANPGAHLVIATGFEVEASDVVD